MGCRSWFASLFLSAGLAVSSMAGCNSPSEPDLGESLDALTPGSISKVSPPSVMCTHDTQCTSTQYCAKAAGHCLAKGVCKARPAACPTNDAPVCGCDGAGYDDACAAAMAGVNVASLGACKVPLPCKANADCPSDSYCKAKGCDVPGVCATRPQACIMVYMPVCGCDSKTYSNACAAASAGVNVLHDGPCGCAGDADCPSGQVCELSVGCAEPSACVPGCHADAQCGAGEVCNQVACKTCPCPGICGPASGCTGDADCPVGRVCELGAGCTLPKVCVPGCHTSTQCQPGQVCTQPACLTCPCPGLCL